MAREAANPAGSGTIDIRVLGPVDVYRDGGLIDIGHTRQRVVLAMLAARVGVVVSAAQLVEELWQDRPPQRARDTLYSYLSRLRKSFSGTDVRIERRSGGYALDADPMTVDMHRYRDLVERARNTGTLADWDRAMELWRGEPFADLDVPLLDELRTTLDSERFAAVLDHNDALLEHGEHARALPELRELAGQYPWDERLAGQLMLALYRSGRPSEAQDHYRWLSTRLVSERGTEPGPELTRLHREILAEDPAESCIDTAFPTPPRPPIAVPRQLPGDSCHFTGRGAEVAMLDAGVRASGAARIWAITGQGGVGKTWLALHWAHRRRDDFPDGQLYVNLHGFDPAAEPDTPESALRDLLESLGVAPSAIPSSIGAMAALYRSLIAGKRLLLVIDNARTANQVTPLLPGDETCLTIITARAQLAGLAAAHGIHTIRLDTLPSQQAHAALARFVGDERLAAEPEATATLLDFCAGLPLALGILAARAATYPHLPLAALADSVRDSQSRLDALDTGELSASLRSVLDSSVAALSPEAQDSFDLLGLAPGTSVSGHAAASLVGRSVPEVDMNLRELEDAHLIHQYAPYRYRMHDLTRLYAAERAQARVGERQRVAALRRVIDHYVHTAVAGRYVIQPGVAPWDGEAPVEGCVLGPLRDPDSAKEWFDVEHVGLLVAQEVAEQHGWDTTVWRLAWAMTLFFQYKRRCETGLIAWRRALRAAESMNDVTAQSVAAGNCWRLLAFQGQHRRAQKYLDRRMALAEASGDLLELASAHQSRCLAYEYQCDYRSALRHSTRSLELSRQAGHRLHEVQALNAVGWDRAHLGEYDAARDCCEAALAIAHAIPSERDIADIRDSLGYIAFHTGRLDDAVDHYRQAVQQYRRVGVYEEEPRALSKLADTLEALGEHAEAARLRNEAAAVYDAHGFPEQAAKLRRLVDAVSVWREPE